MQLVVDMCLQPEAMTIFLSLLDPAIVVVKSSYHITIQASSGAIDWIYLESINRFCINGVASNAMAL